MNIFELAFVGSAISGIAGGIGATDSASWSTVACGGVGLLAGVASYALSLVPGVVTMKAAPNNGLSPSRLSNVGAALFFAGALISPFVAYYSAAYFLKVAIHWFQ